MNRVFCLAKRNFLETVKDVLSLSFIFALPIIMLIMMEAIFGNIEEASMFKIENFAPGICTFGFTFVMLFVALNITTDKKSAFMMRILVSPVKSGEYLLSFVLSSIPLMLIQTILFYIISLLFGLQFNGSWFLSIIMLMPSMLFYIACGLLISVLAKTDNQAGPLSSIIITGAGMLGGVWMPIETMGGGFKSVCEWLPFYNGIKFARYPFMSFDTSVFISLLIVLGYTLIIGGVAIFIFNKKIKK